MCAMDAYKSSVPERYGLTRAASRSQGAAASAPWNVDEFGDEAESSVGFERGRSSMHRDRRATGWAI